MGVAAARALTLQHPCRGAPFVVAAFCADTEDCPFIVVAKPPYTARAICLPDG